MQPSRYKKFLALAQRRRFAPLTDNNLKPIASKHRRFTRLCLILKTFWEFLNFSKSHECVLHNSAVARISLSPPNFYNLRNRQKKKINASNPLKPTKVRRPYSRPTKLIYIIFTNLEGC